MPRVEAHPVCIGDRFGDWTVVAPLPRNSARQSQSLCECKCGVSRPVAHSMLTRGKTHRCRKCAADARRKYGEKSGSPEHSIWRAMVGRCHSSESKAYRDYGARGITVCDRWRYSFESFLEDMGDRPSPDHSLDRIDNDGNYEPSNCRWVLIDVQSRNKRSSKLLTFRGETMCAADWADRLGMAREVLYGRLWNGWTVEESLSIPVGATRSTRKQLSEKGSHTEKASGASQAAR